MVLQPKHTTKKIVAITGAAGYLGQRLLVHFARQPWVERIIALDVLPVPSDGRVLSYQVDISDTTTLRAILTEHGVTNMVHAAFRIVQPRGWTYEQWYAANSASTISVWKAVRFNPILDIPPIHLTFVSSVAVYGYKKSDRGVVTEAGPIGPTMRYGIQKAETEGLLRLTSILFSRDFKKPSFQPSAVIRMAAIAGPTGKDYSHLRALTAQPFFVVADGGHALTQAIHEDDAAALVCAAVQHNVDGIFNGAPDDSASWRDIGRLTNKPILSLPQGMLHFAAHFNRAVPALRGFTHDVVDLFAHSLVVDNQAAREELHWKPRYSTCDAFGQMFEALGTAR